mmetsp:Transcript_51859/g.150917  ORF Transcript_51859/g.150917 Transcript_51859/m.150917 type:complete len:277 (-) Transcript_51859:196-1026(-)
MVPCQRSGVGQQQCDVDIPLVRPCSRLAACPVDANRRASVQLGVDFPRRTDDVEGVAVDLGGMLLLYVLDLRLHPIVVLVREVDYDNERLDANTGEQPLQCFGQVVHLAALAHDRHQAGAQVHRIDSAPIRPEEAELVDIQCQQRRVPFQRNPQPRLVTLRRWRSCSWRRGGRRLLLRFRLAGLELAASVVVLVVVVAVLVVIAFVGRLGRLLRFVGHRLGQLAFLGVRLLRGRLEQLGAPKLLALAAQQPPTDQQCVLHQHQRASAKQSGAQRAP